MRALDFLVAGRLSDSLRSNALLIPSLGLVLAGLAAEIVHPGRGLFTTGSSAARMTGTGVLFAAIFFSILRNLPLEPCRWLIPD